MRMKPMVGLLVLGMVLLYVWERVDVVRVGYQIEQLKTKRVALQRERDELRLKVSALTAPDRLARVATEQVGLMPPQPGQVVLVRVEPTPSGRPAPTQPEMQLAKSEGTRKRP
jgi:cell division protein FtsL